MLWRVAPKAQHAFKVSAHRVNLMAPYVVRMMTVPEASVTVVI